MRSSIPAALVALIVLIWSPLEAKPLTSSSSCSKVCELGWQCLSSTVRKRSGGQKSYLARCLPSCAMMKKNPTLFNKSLEILDTRCKESRVERQREGVCTRICSSRWLCVGAEAKKKTSQKTYLARCAAECIVDKRDLAALESLAQIETRRCLPKTKKKQPTPTVKPKPVRALDCRAECDRYWSCVDPRRKRLVKSGDWLSRCLLNCYALVSEVEKSRFSTRVANVCQRAPGPPTELISIGAGCAELCKTSWGCLPPNSQLLIGSEKRYIELCKPSCEEARKDPARWRHKRRQLVAGCRKRPGPHKKTPRTRGKKTLHTSGKKISCDALCMRGWSCLVPAVKKRTTRKKWFPRCLASCRKFEKDPQRFRLGVQSIERMCKRSGR